MTGLTRSLLLLVALWSLPQASTILSLAGQDLPVLAWSPTGRLNEARHSACVAALKDSRALVTGGENASGVLSSVEIYGPDGQFTSAAPLTYARSRHTCTTLKDGRVMVAGGVGAVPAELYDPDADSWTPLDTPGIARLDSTATLRPDGTVLLVGGSIDGAPTAVIEVFDPSTNSISLLTAALASARTSHAAALLPDGGVLIVGGSTGSAALASTEIVRPDGTILPGPDLPEPRLGTSATALLDGRVLIVGGNDGNSDVPSAVVFSPRDTALRLTGTLNTARSRHVALAIPGNGSILIAGGDSAGIPTASTEIFDLSAETFVPAGDLTIARRNLAAAALGQPGIVLSVGGVNDSGPLDVCGTFVAPAVSLDKLAYSSGDRVVVTGSHWKPGPLKLTLTSTNLLGTSTGSLNAGVTADATGSFQFTSPNPLTSAAVGSNLLLKLIGGDGTTASASGIQLDPTSTTITLSATTATAGQPVTITANVREPLGLVSALPGPVNFSVDGTLLGTSTTQTFDAAGNHFFTFTSSALRGGSHSIRAAYAGNGAIFPASSASASIQMNRMATTLGILATHIVTVGETVQVTITVKPVTTVGLPAPRGVVQLVRNGALFNSNLTPNDLSFSSTATFSFPAPGPPQTLNYQASYLGDDNYSAAGPFFNNSIVNPAQASLTVTPAKTGYVLGDDIAVNIRIQPQLAGSVTPTGTLQITQGGIGPAASLVVPPADASGVSTAQLKAGLLGVGNATLNIHYSGDANFLAGDAQISVPVGKATPQIAMLVFNVTPLATSGYGADIIVTDPNFQQPGRKPGGSIGVYYNGSATAAQTFPLAQEGSSHFFGFFQLSHNSIFAVPGTKFPIRFVYSGDSNYKSVEATCNANVDLIDGSNVACDTYPH